MSPLLRTQKQDIGRAPRSNAPMAYDTARARMVLFGDLASDNATALNDTWAWQK